MSSNLARSSRLLRLMSSRGSTSKTDASPWISRSTATSAGVTAHFWMVLPWLPPSASETLAVCMIFSLGCLQGRDDLVDLADGRRQVGGSVKRRERRAGAENRRDLVDRVRRIRIQRLSRNLQHGALVLVPDDTGSRVGGDDR